jgi:flagellum-specific peptidoglycan hydrolase FlgJ
VALAVEQGKRTGVDPRIIMAQAALETGYGKSVPNENYFGIKGSRKIWERQRTLEFIGGKIRPVGVISGAIKAHRRL